MAERAIIGWDVGGAHLKAALLIDGKVADVAQVACALWKGLDRLDVALDSVLARWPGAEQAAHAVTMTGELADCFASRQHGVVSIATRLVARLGAQRLRLFAADGRWVEVAAAEREWRCIASANWLGTARFVAQQLSDPRFVAQRLSDPRFVAQRLSHPRFVAQRLSDPRFVAQQLSHPRRVASRTTDALLVDVGSTTTDIVPIASGRAAAIGRDDSSRLASGELVYHGVVRTPLCAFGPRIEFRGVERNVMNELFATAADVYRLTGELDAEHDQHDSADGAAKDVAATERRLARMIGLDARDGSTADWQRFAWAWRERQLAELRRNAERVVAASAALGVDAPLVGAGCGDFLARSLADSMQRRYVSIDTLMPLGDASQRERGWARVAAPCVAVALLAEHEACGW